MRQGMPFDYACFISHVHASEALMKEFIEDLFDALKSSLEPYKREAVFLDEARLRPGFRFNEALAEAMCLPSGDQLGNTAINGG